MNRKFRKDNPFWQSLQAQLDEATPLPEPPDSRPLVEPAEVDVKRTRLELERMKRRNLEAA
jgi:hypothetical protein